jgi:hypothetical protein
MEKLGRLFEKLKENRAVAQDIEAAKEDFGFKPFAITFRPLATAAKSVRLVLALFSIVTGFGCLYSGMAAAVPLPLAVILALVLLVLVETLKGVTLGIGAKLAYTGAGLSALPLLMLALAFAGASVFLSLQGAKALYQMADQTGATIAAAYDAKSDSLANLHQARAQAAKEELAAYKKSVSWKGKIDMYNAANKQVILSLTDRARLAENDQRTALAALAARQSTAITENTERATINTALWVWLAAANEALILLALWFGVYYRYRLAADSGVIEHGSTYSLSSAEISRLLEFAALSGSGEAKQLHQAPIGFTMAKDKDKEEFKDGFKGGFKGVGPEQPKEGFKPGFKGVHTPFKGGANEGSTPQDEQALRAFLAKYPQVVKCVREGKTIGKTVKECGVSESTVHNVKRCLSTLAAHER